MSLLAILIEGVGTGVAKGILNIWLEEQTFGKEISKNFVGIIASKIKDSIITRNKVKRQFEEVSERVAQNLLPIFENAEDISEERKQEIAHLAGGAVNNLKISSELLVRENLDSKKIEKLLLSEAYFPNEENPLINFNEKEETLYKRVMADSAQYIVDTASKLPKFSEKSLTEILKRGDVILGIVTEVLEEVKSIRRQLQSPGEQAHEFERRYRKAVISNLDKLILFGVDVSDSTKKYKLSVAYVTLLVEYSGSKNEEKETDASLEDDMSNQEYSGEQILSINEAIGRTNRLLLRGPAGSGKTTLMKWIAVKSAGKDLDKELKEWNECVPFFIRLRNFPDANLPSPKDLPALTAQSLSDEMPEKWVAEKLNTGKAIILVDGIDEIAENQREKVKNWISDIDNSYPDNKWVVTSRPYAAKKDWLDDLGFTDADLQDMNVENVKLFIDHWHKAVSESEKESKEELDSLKTKLKITITENRSLRKLATNPLLCAIICALHKDRNEHLPSNRMDLYEACIGMFFRRDKERKIKLEDYIDIDDRPKRALLEDLAYWLVRNDKSECQVDFTDERFNKKIPALSDIPRGVKGEAIRRYFVERSGILRQPTLQTIDFPHRTFMEYFAAKAIVEENDFSAMIKNASNDQWREVIQLACGIARREEGNDTILEIIKLGDKEIENKASLHLLAVVCMGMLREVREDVKLEVQHRLIKLVPPKNVEAARQLASAEDLVVPFLKYDKKRKAQELAMSVRTLAIIGEDKALLELSKYCQDNRKSVEYALLNGIKYTKEPKAYAKQITLNIKHLYIDGNMPLEIIKSLPNLKRIESWRVTIKDLAIFSNVSNLEDLIVGHSRIGDLTPISKLVNLKTLNIWGRNIQDLSPLSKLVNLTNLRISSREINYINALSHLTKLQKLHIGDFWEPIQTTDISPLSNLLNLKQLNISGNNIEDISPLSKLINIEELYLAGANLFDLMPLAKLVNLRTLSIKNVLNGNVEPKNIEYLSGLVNLIHLDLSDIGVNDINSVSKLKKLKKISISESFIEDLTPLAELIDLESINISTTKVENLNALSLLKNIKELDANSTSISDLSPLSKMVNLAELNIGTTMVQNLEPLSELISLKKLNISGTIISDLTPLSHLPNLLELDISSIQQIPNLSPLSNLPCLKRLIISPKQEKYLQTISESKLEKLSVQKI